MTALDQLKELGNVRTTFGAVSWPAVADAVTEPQAEVLVLAYVMGRTFAESDRVLGLRPGGSRQRHRRAIDKLRESPDWLNEAERLLPDEQRAMLRSDASLGGEDLAAFKVLMGTEGLRDWNRKVPA